MTTFLDGPAEGVSLLFSRAPVYLRVVRDRNGEWDALDQYGDVPEEGEEVFVYERVGGVGYACVRRGGHGPRSYVIAEWRHVPDAPVEDLRDTDAWRAWATAQGQDREENDE